MASPDPSSFTGAASSKPVQEPAGSKEPLDASSTSSSSSSSKPSVERAHKTSPSPPGKRTTHQSPGAENRSSLQKPSHSNRPFVQNRNVQWVRVSPQGQKGSDSSTHDKEDLGKHVSSCSSLTLAPQNEAPSSSATPLQAASLSLADLDNRATENVEVVNNTIASSTEVATNIELEPSVSEKSPHDLLENSPTSDNGVVQEIIEDDRSHSRLTEDIEARSAGLVYEAAHDYDSSANDFCQAMEEQMNAASMEDEQTNEPQQQELSRSSSLNAKARVFVPNIGNPPSAAPPQPPQPQQMHFVPSPPPILISLNATPGILPVFPPSSPLPSPRLGGFPLPMAGPPPPPIPASIMGPIPLLGPPHPVLLKVGPPPPPVIPSSPYLIHVSSSSVPVQPQIPSTPLVNPLIEPLGNQPVKHSGEALHDQHQPQKPDLSAAQPGSTKFTLTEDLRAKIVKQVEFYFSDTNLPTDYYLMKFVKKDPEGFVPISIVANFRKVKNLTKNHSVVAAALCSSKQLVVSSDCKKVRRVQPLPHIDLQELQARTVVAENLPPDYSIESMQKLFGTVGNVKMVRVCEPEAINGAHQAKLSKADMVVSNKLHALVEYETVEQAERAVAELTDQRNWRRGLHVRLLLRKTTKHASKSHKLNEGADGSATEDDVTPSSSDSVVEGTREEDQIQERSEDLLGGDHSQNDGSSKKGRGRGQGRGRGRGHLNGGRSHPVGTPPHANSLTNFEPKPPLGPRMPDGTRGFTLGRGKVMPSNSL